MRCCEVSFEGGGGAEGGADGDRGREEVGGCEVCEGCGGSGVEVRQVRRSVR